MKLNFTTKSLRHVLVLMICSIFFTSGFAQQRKSTQDQKTIERQKLNQQAKIYDNNAKSGTESKPRPVGDKASDRIEYEYNMLKNPYTNKIPEKIFNLEKKFTKGISKSKELKPLLQQAKSSSTKDLDVNFSYFKNRGPYNVGGRTRALAIDNTNENIILAGGVSGGLWRSENGGQTWKKTTGLHQDPSITCIVQDPRSGYSNIWYFGTGERSGNSASGGGAFFLGTGIYKSIDGGKTWSIIPSTFNLDNNIATTTPFEIINSIAVNPVNGDLYVASIIGILKSTDGGNTFSLALNGGFDNWSEIMITPSGNIYASIEYFGDPAFGFFKSTDGVNWEDITPNFTFFQGRTVMAYDPSDEDTVYFFAQNYLSAAQPLLFKYVTTEDSCGEYIFENGNGGGEHTFNHADVKSTVIDFKYIDNSFQLEVNGTPIHNKIVEVENYQFDAESEVHLVFADNTEYEDEEYLHEVHMSWIPNDNNLPRLRVIVDDNGNVTMMGTRDPWTSKLEEIVTEDGSPFNVINFLSDNNTFKITNIDDGGLDGMYGKVNVFCNDKWTDLSANLPTAIGGPVGNINLQGHYNMFIRVKPDDSNFIVLGGTNLYRSTTGFTTKAGQESWIGGYSSVNNISVYTDHHPDQHNFIFYPSNPNKALSGNDGGVQVTNDVRTNLGIEPVDWISLNNGYLTTQSYSVAFDPQANSDDLVSGFQDNGNWFTGSNNPQVPWSELPFGGDGSFNAIADGGNSIYYSTQFANIYRLNFDDAGNFLSFARIRPAIMTNPSFINSFVLDPVNDNIMYLPDGNRMLRNSNLDEIPTNTFAFATKNWVALEQTTNANTITAVDVSRYPVASRLYYGTSAGGVFRMDKANLDNQDVVDISTGKGLPPGYVNNISVDPSNSDRVLLTFSSYGIPSLFFTENAGETWTNISGNLEENADGSGNGPSIRWASFFGNKQAYLVATSTGLYVTSELDGNNTTWFYEPFVVGNAVVSQVKTRKDGFVAVATHGNGLFSAKLPIFPWSEIPDPSLSVARLLDNINIDWNHADMTVDITDVFVSESETAIAIELTNSNPDLVTATLEGNTISLSYTPNASGTAVIGLMATAGVESVSEGFTISVREPPLYEQFNAAVGSAPSQFFIDDNGLSQTADDFIVPEGSVWTINKIAANGGQNNNPILDNATVVIYKDSLGAPAKEVFNSGTMIPSSEADDANLVLEFPESIQLNAGSYWISVYVNHTFLPGGTQWFWNTQSEVKGGESQFKDPLNLFGTGAVDWTNSSEAFVGRLPVDQIFQLFGSATDGEDTATAVSSVNEEVLATIDSGNNALAWPNPSHNVFNFNMGSISKSSSNNEKATIRIFNLSGQLVYQKENLSISKQFTWDASSSPKGIYLVNIQGKNLNFKGKLVKK